MGRYAKKFSLPSNHTSVIELLFFHDSNTVLSFDHNNTSVWIADHDVERTCGELSLFITESYKLAIMP